MNLRLFQAALLLAAAGAIAILLALGTVVGLIGLAAIILGTLLTAPYGRGPGQGWWTLLAVGSVLSVIGALVALASEGLGGLLALLGGVATVAGQPSGSRSTRRSVHRVSAEAGLSGRAGTRGGLRRFASAGDGRRPRSARPPVRS